MQPQVRYRTKASTAQLNYLAEHMKSHPTMAVGMAAGVSQTLQGRVNLESLWESLANKLNSLGGPIKTVPKWKQAWRDLRNNVKKKAIYNQNEFRGFGLGCAGNGPPTLKELTHVEEQVLSIMGPVAANGLLRDTVSTDIINEDSTSQTRSGQNSSPSPPSPIKETECEITVKQEFEINEDDDCSSQTSSGQISFCRPPSVSPRPKKRKSDNRVKEVCEIMTIPQKIEETKDDFEIYGQYIASELRNVKNERAAIRAKYFINNVILKARMGEYDNCNDPLV